MRYLKDFRLTTYNNNIFFQTRKEQKQSKFIII